MSQSTRLNGVLLIITVILFLVLCFSVKRERQACDVCTCVLGWPTGMDWTAIGWPWLCDLIADSHMIKAKKTV